jgi:hypothetical protein
MRELRDHGYADLITEHVDGRIRRHYVVTAMPESDGSQAVLTAALSSTGGVAHEPDQSVQGTVVVDPQDVDPQDEQPKELEALARFDSFEWFWDVYPRHEGRAEATKALARALRKTDLQTIIAAAVRYRDDPNREDGYTAHGATWLNQERWNDDPLPVKRSRPNRVGQAGELLRQAMEG